MHKMFKPVKITIVIDISDINAYIDNFTNSVYKDDIIKYVFIKTLEIRGFNLSEKSSNIYQNILLNINKNNKSDIDIVNYIKNTLIIECNNTLSKIILPSIYAVYYFTIKIKDNLCYLIFSFCN